jgi:hypothetical protein
MNLWQLTPDGLREFDLEGKRVRRIEGIHLPTESEGRDGSWRDFFKVATPLAVGEVAEIVWPSAGRFAAAQRSTTTSVTVALLDRRPAGPWAWGFGDEAGRSGWVSRAGEPAAQTIEVEIAFLLAHLLNAAEDLPLSEPPASAYADDVVTAVRIGDQGYRAVMVAGTAVCTLAGRSPAAEQVKAGLTRWSGATEVVSALAAVAQDLGAWAMVAVWDLPDPAGWRDAVVAGGLAAPSVARLDAAGPESFRHLARLAGRLGEHLSWAEGIAALDSPSPDRGPSVVDLVAAGDLDGATAGTEVVVDRLDAAHR